MKLKKLPWIVRIAMLGFCSSAQAESQVTLYPTGDAFLAQGNAYGNTNYDRDVLVMKTAFTYGYTRESVIEFDLTGINGNTYTPNVALLVVNAYAGGNYSMQVGVTGTATPAPFTERTVTWNTFFGTGPYPYVYPTVDYQDITVSGTVPMQYAFDVTPYVLALRKQKVNTMTLVLYAKNRDNSKYVIANSKDDGSNLGPVLSLSYSDGVTRIIPIGPAMPGTATKCTSASAMMGTPCSSTPAGCTAGTTTISSSMQCVHGMAMCLAPVQDVDYCASGLSTSGGICGASAGESCTSDSSCYPTEVCANDHTCHPLPISICSEVTGICWVPPNRPSQPAICGF